MNRLIAWLRVCDYARLVCSSVVQPWYPEYDQYVVGKALSEIHGGAVSVVRILVYRRSTYSILDSRKTNKQKGQKGIFRLGGVSDVTAITSCDPS